MTELVKARTLIARHKRLSDRRSTITKAINFNKSGSLEFKDLEKLGRIIMDHYPRLLMRIYISISQKIGHLEK